MCALDPSASVAAYVATVVAPSATLAEAVAPSEKIGVLSLASLIVIVIVAWSESLASKAATTNVYEVVVS